MHKVQASVATSFHDTSQHNTNITPPTAHQTPSADTNITNFVIIAHLTVLQTACNRDTTTSNLIYLACLQARRLLYTSTLSRGPVPACICRSSYYIPKPPSPATLRVQKSLDSRLSAIELTSPSLLSASPSLFHRSRLSRSCHSLYIVAKDLPTFTSGLV